MNNKTGSIILLITIYLCSCASIKTADYFRLIENQIETYNGYFIKYQNDSNYKKIEKIFGRISDKDTVTDQNHIIYKTINIEGHLAYYAIATTDTLKKNPTIGPKHFLFSSLIFYNDTVFVAPAYRKADLDKLRFNDFKFKIPPRLTKKDTIKIIDGKKTTLLENFSIAIISINNKRFSNCLSFDIRDVWPTSTYTGKVWLHKKYGLLKWIRSTGRIETRVL